MFNLHRGAVRGPDARDSFSSFIPGVRQAFADELGRFLLPDGGWTALLAQATEGDAKAGWTACVTLSGPGVGEHPLSLELRQPGPGVQAWFVGRHLTLGYWNGPDGSDPFASDASRRRMQDIRARVEAADAAGPGSPALDAVLAAVARFKSFAQLHDRHFRYASPREALIRLGFRCNQKCDFCWQGREWPEPPPETYHRWVDELADTGQGVLHFSGGEPTIHPELPALVRHAHARGLEVWLQTNAIRLAKPRFLAELVDAGLAGIFASYHSHLAEVSDVMTAAPGTHKGTEAGILATLDAGKEVVLNAVIDRRNLAGLPGFAQHVVDTFAKRSSARVSVSFSHPGPSYDPAQYDANLVSLDELRGPLVEALTILEAAGVPTVTGGTCGFPPCVFRDAPRFATFDDPETYVDEDAPDRNFVAACERCAVKKRCIGLRSPYLRRLGDRGVVPFDREPAEARTMSAGPRDR